MEKLKNEYLKNVKSMDSDIKVQQLNLIEKKFEKCKELSDEKVLLANQTYEMVDKHIRRLDADLARFEAELKDRSFSDTENTSPSDKIIVKGLSNATINSHDTSCASDLSNFFLLNRYKIIYCFLKKKKRRAEKKKETKRFSCFIVSYFLITIA